MPRRHGRRGKKKGRGGHRGGGGGGRGGSRNAVGLQTLSEGRENDISSPIKPGIGIKICLCMIVKNESKIIERCLRAAKPILDYVSIVDTGSTDNTKELISGWCEMNNIPHKVHEEPFKNFSHNRTHSYQAAKASFPDSSYFLLCDADMILKVSPGFNKQSLKGDCYMLEQYSDKVRYWNVRLLGNRNVEKWECVGVTHEYWKPTPEVATLKLRGLEYDDREDGGCKDDKYTRDKRLLLEGYNDPETPDDLKTRYSYYIGQTMECLKDIDEAIKWYKIRSEKKNSWEEEAWYANYKIGLCYLAKGEEEKGVYTLLQAWDRRPWRIEPLYKLAVYYRAKHPTPDKGHAMNHIALMYAMRAKESPYPENDVLFVEYDVYEFLLDVEIAIVSFYVRGKKNVGRAAAKRLVQKIKQGKIKDNNLAHIKETIAFYGF